MTTDTDASPAPPPLAFAVTTGGVPTPEQLAAITVALTPVTIVVAPDDDEDEAPRRPAWHRAALLEATGHPRLTSAPDLQHAR